MGAMGPTGTPSARTRGWRARCALAVTLVMIFVGSILVAAPASADNIRDKEYWLADYGITTAWKTTRGAGVTIAIIDTGVDGTHPDLTGTVVGGTDVSGIGTSDGQTPVGTDNQHATMVASLLAGHGHGAGGLDGIIGVAPDAKILSVSVGLGVGSVNSDDQIAKAVRWSADNGADIINMSLTRNTLDWPTSWDAAFLYAMKKGVIIVAAAGNRGSGTIEVGAPATMPGVVVIAGVDQNGDASFDASAQGITLSVAAPSEQLVGAAPGGGYYEWAGTSGATPLVVGVLALIEASHPGLSAGNVINRLTATATPKGNAITYGSGLMNAAKAVTATVASVQSDPATDLQNWIRLNRRAASTAAPEQTTGAPVISPGKSTAPQAAQAISPFGRVLPTIDSLRNVGIPLLVYLIFAAVFILVLRAIWREVKRARRRP